MGACDVSRIIFDKKSFKMFSNNSQTDVYYSIKQHFFNCYLAVRMPTLGHSQGGSLTNLMLITAFSTILT